MSEEASSSTADASTSASASQSGGAKLTLDEKRRFSAWRQSVKVSEVLQSRLEHGVKVAFDLSWIEFCKHPTYREYIGNLPNGPPPGDRKRMLYDCFSKSTKLASDEEIPELSKMDVTYVAQILETETEKGYLIDNSTWDQVKILRHIRNELCHKYIKSMDQETFGKTTEDLETASIVIARPAKGSKNDNRMCHVRLGRGKSA